MANISTIKVGNTSYGITATPTAHASTATTYGAASASNYGHVKLSDNYTSSAGTAASGIGASSAAVYNAYNTLNSNLIRLNKRAHFFIGQATKTANSTNTSFTFEELGFTTSLLPTGIQDDIFIADVLYVIDTPGYAARIYRGNLTWSYNTSKGWTLYQYNIGGLYYEQQVWLSDSPPWTQGEVPSTLAGSYQGHLVLNIKPNTIPDTQTSYTLTIVLYNVVHFSNANGALYES